MFISVKDFFHIEKKNVSIHRKWRKIVVIYHAGSLWQNEG